MAKFVGGSTDDLMKVFEKLQVDAPQMFAEMVTAGAQVVKDNMSMKMSPAFRSALSADNFELSKVYETPSDKGINCQAKIVGYFINKKGKKTPAPLVANMMEYGSTNREYGKQAFLRASFNKKQIEAAMLQVQKKYITEE